MALSRRNRRGVLLLIVLALVIAIIPRLLIEFKPYEDSVISFQEAKLIETEIRQKKTLWSKEKKNQPKRPRKKYYAPKEKFDPNQYSVEDWMKLGLSKKQSLVITDFSKRGLKSNSDLERIYVMPKELLEKIKDSTYYPKSYVYNREKDARTSIDHNQIYVPLNSGSQVDFEKIPGIGPFYANEIVKHRKELGGYIKKEQLLDLWKFDMEKFLTIRNYVKLDSTKVKRININRATVDELKTHPYISYKVANSIVKMRNSHGAYKSMDDLLNSKLINIELLTKIEPYLTIE